MSHCYTVVVGYRRFGNMERSYLSINNEVTYIEIGSSESFYN